MSLLQQSHNTNTTELQTVPNVDMHQYLNIMMSNIIFKQMASVLIPIKVPN